MYKDQLESMLVTHVFPEFQSPHGYMRARVRLSVDGGSFGFVKWRGNLSKLELWDVCPHITAKEDLRIFTVHVYSPWLPVLPVDMLL